MLFTKNISNKDRLLRAIFSFILFVGAYLTGSYIMLALALFCLYEAIYSWCVVYALLGKNSCPRK
ncbi:MAG: DUF2892 domain-containing protein [Chlamydiales bacterium]|nr:DUF2892 domain-containing protein [Chlamydiales bacterium]